MACVAQAALLMLVAWATPYDRCMAACSSGHAECFERCKRWLSKGGTKMSRRLNNHGLVAAASAFDGHDVVSVDDLAAKMSAATARQEAADWTDVEVGEDVELGDDMTKRFN